MTITIVNCGFHNCDRLTVIESYNPIGVAYCYLHVDHAPARVESPRVEAPHYNGDVHRHDEELVHNGDASPIRGASVRNGGASPIRGASVRNGGASPIRGAAQPQLHVDVQHDYIYRVEEPPSASPIGEDALAHRRSLVDSPILVDDPPVLSRAIEEDEGPECAICGDKETIALNCGHIVCSSCLESLHKLECPICRRPLAGPLMTQEIRWKIFERIDEEKRIREENDATQALLAQLVPGYVPNENY